MTARSLSIEPKHTQGGCREFSEYLLAGNFLKMAGEPPEPGTGHFSGFLLCANTELLSGYAQLLLGEAFHFARFFNLLLWPRLL